MTWIVVYVCLTAYMLAVDAGEANCGTDCNSILTDNPSAASGVYGLCLGDAYCDMETDSGGWTVFQRRATNTTDFHQTWDTYAVGFGDVSAEYWLGNNMIHIMTAGGSCELRIELEDWEGGTGYATYQDFSIDEADDLYSLHVGAYSGDIGDSLTYHNGRPFSTYDQDNDDDSRHCAQINGGAWWHGSCAYTYSALNGQYHEGITSGGDVVRWYHWRSTPDYSYKKTAMKLRCSN